MSVERGLIIDCIQNSRALNPVPKDTNKTRSDPKKSIPTVSKGTYMNRKLSKLKRFTGIFAALNG